MTLNEGTLVYGVDGDKAMGVVRAITPVAMDVTLICTGPALGVGAFGLICPSVAAGPGLASACGLIRSLSAPEVWGVTHHSLALRGSYCPGRVPTNKPPRTGGRISCWQTKPTMCSASTRTATRTPRRSSSRTRRSCRDGSPVLTDEDIEASGRRGRARLRPGQGDQGDGRTAVPRHKGRFAARAGSRRPRSRQGPASTRAPGAPLRQRGRPHCSARIRRPSRLNAPITARACARDCTAWVR